MQLKLSLVMPNAPPFSAAAAAAAALAANSTIAGAIGNVFVSQKVFVSHRIPVLLFELLHMFTEVSVLLQPLVV